MVGGSGDVVPDRTKVGFAGFFIQSKDVRVSFTANSTSSVRVNVSVADCLSLSLRAEWENSKTVLDIGLNVFGCQVVGWDLCAFWVSTVDLEGYKTVRREPSDKVKYI